MNLIETEGLTKVFKGIEAVQNVNMKIRKGACTALLGPNGAGKTTTLNMLTGLLKPTSGKINFHETYKGDRRKYIGYLPQQPKFYSWMSGLEFMKFAAELSGLTKKEAEKRSLEMLELTGLSEAAGKKVGGYSGGMRQRLGIAQALVNNPPLLLLDEPVSALDPIGRREVLELMIRLKKETSIIFSTHVLHDAEGVSDDIYIMKKGRIVTEGRLNDLQTMHEQPALFIETEDDLTLFSKNLTSREWVTEVNSAGKEAVITVTDVDRARQELLGNSDLLKLKIVKFEVVKTSLEDLFLKVMKS